MTYLWLVWTGLARDPLRVALTTGSVAVAFALLWLLKGVDSGLQQLVESIPDDRLHVVRRGPAYLQLPLASMYALDNVPGVLHVTPFGYHGARFGPSEDFVQVMAVDLERYLSVTFNYRLEPATVQAFFATQGAVIAGADISERAGWRVGDRITLMPIGAAQGEQWSFELVGTWDHEDSPDESDWLLVSYAHMDQSMPEERQGFVNAFGVLIEDSSHAATVAAAIDERFRNSSAPTLTARTRDTFTSGRHPGQIRLVANSIVGASFFAILFCTAGVMAQSVRDRHREFAMMKSLGFRNRTLLLGIFGESVAICAVGALAALLPFALIDAREVLGRYGAVIHPPAPTLYPLGFAIALMLAALSVCLPGWRVATLSPAEVAR